MEKTAEQIYNEFTVQLSKWAQDGKIPETGNQDISYGLNLQKKRLERHHARMKYEFKERDRLPESVTTLEFASAKYRNKAAWKSYRKRVEYYKEDELCFSTEDNEHLYTIITWLKDAEDTSMETTYCCPNCGAISEVRVLLECCPYCHTRFLMSDLFPKITNFYFMMDYGLKEDEGKRTVRIWTAAGALVSVAAALPGVLEKLLHGGGLFPLLALILPACAGAVVGYFILSFWTLGGLMKETFLHAPKSLKNLSAMKGLTDFMRSYDPDFSFEYFRGKVQALMKILIFTEDRSRLSIYEGQVDGSGFDDIIDSQFGNAIGLNGHRVEGDYCYLDLTVYMADVYCRNHQINRQMDQFRLGLCRNISHPADYGFSIKKVNCRSCGASFDASMEGICPYCKSKYDLKEDDWVITDVRKM